MEITRQEKMEGPGNEMELKIKALKEKWDRAVKLNPEGASKAYFDFAEKLRGNYGGQEGCQKYAAFHIAAGGTFSPEEMEKFDFPGESSIEKFVDNFLEQERLRQGYERIMGKIAGLRNVCREKGISYLRCRENLVDFLRGLEKKFGPDKALSCVAYHIASGSTMDEKTQNKKFDFEGEYSIETFIDKMLEKVEEEGEQ